MLGLAQNQGAAQVEGMSDFGGPHVARGANKKGGSKLALQPGDLLAHHRLGDAKALRCRREGAGLHHGREVGETPQISKPSQGVIGLIIWR